MRLVACVKLVYDETQIPITDDGFDLDSAPVKVSDMDMNAVEEAVRIKEEHGGDVTAVLVVTGPFDEAVMKEALAIGADRALVVDGEPVRGHNPLRTAKAIMGALKEVGIEPDLILCGEGSSDQYSCLLAPMLAELMGLPAATFAVSLKVEDGKAIVERALETGYEVLEVPLPAVISVTSEINEPRIPTVLQIMRAGKKERHDVDPGNLDLASPEVRVVEMKPFIKERRRERIEDVEKAISKVLSVLKEKGVIS